MGQVLHSGAKTTQVIRREIQQSQDSIATLAQRYNLNPKTIVKWKNRSFTHDAKMGPKNPRSRSLSPEEEAAVVAFRKHTLLPLDDCLYALQDTIPHLTRSSLHRCYQRHGISRLPSTDETTSKRQPFQECPIGYIHIDIAQLRTEEGTAYMFVAIDRVCKFCYVEVHKRQRQEEAVEFMERLIEKVPYKIHTILTDNGRQFTGRRKGEKTTKEHRFERKCEKRGIKHKLTKVNHPWTNGQVERMNRTLKEATVKRYHYEGEEEVKSHLEAFVEAYNYAKRLKALQGKTPYESMVWWWEKEPERFHTKPCLNFTGLYK